MFRCCLHPNTKCSKLRRPFVATLHSTTIDAFYACDDWKSPSTRVRHDSRGHYPRRFLYAESTFNSSTRRLLKNVVHWFWCGSHVADYLWLTDRLVKRRDSQSLIVHYCISAYENAVDNRRSCIICCGVTMRVIFILSLHFLCKHSFDQYLECSLWYDCPIFKIVAHA